MDPLVAQWWWGDRAALEAVLAHELAHIAHRDVVVMTGAASFRLLFEALGRRVADSRLIRRSPSGSTYSLASPPTSGDRWPDR